MDKDSLRDIEISFKAQSTHSIKRALKHKTVNLLRSK